MYFQTSVAIRDPNFIIAKVLRFDYPYISFLFRSQSVF